MDSKTKKFLVNHGYVKDGEDLLEELFDNNDSFKQIDIDIHNDESAVLLGRINEKNVIVKTSEDKGIKRIMLKKKDKNRTLIANINVSDIEDCIYKQFSDSKIEFLFNIYNLSYKLVVTV